MKELPLKFAFPNLPFAFCHLGRKLLASALTGALVLSATPPPDQAVAAPVFVVAFGDRSGGGAVFCEQAVVPQQVSAFVRGELGTDLHLRILRNIINGIRPAFIEIHRRIPSWRRSPLVALFFPPSSYPAFSPNNSDSMPLSGSSIPDLNPTQRTLLDQIAQTLRLSDSDKRYLAQMWRQMVYPTKQKLKIRVDQTSKEGNFILATHLTDGERKSWLGSVPYADVLSDPANEEAAKNVIVTVESLDGGIGENLVRTRWLSKEIANPARASGHLKTENEVVVKLGAKGTDLGYHVEVNKQKVFVSIAEFNLLKLLLTAREGKFNKIYFQPLVNYQSKRSYETLLAAPYLYDRVDPDRRNTMRSYKEILTEANIRFHSRNEMWEQADLPSVEQTMLSLARDPDAPRQPGGHGQWGYHFLWYIYKTAPPADRMTHVLFFKNGDNPNGKLSAAISGYMRRNNMPIIKLTTPATPIDKKGGKDGVREIIIDGKPVYVPEQMEIADARDAGQAEIFEEAGQHGNEVGKQPFNTNIIYFNHDLLHPILQELAALVGEDEIARIISPTLIPKKPKKKDEKYFIPVDSAIGSAIHNVNAYFLTSTDPKVKLILEKHHVDRLLSFVEVPREFFAPVKGPFDIWWQAYSDYYIPNTDTWTLDEAVPGLTPPEVVFQDDDPYWKELQNFVDSLGHAKTRQLTKLELEGPLKLQDADLIGHVNVKNKTEPMIDLKALRGRDKPLVLNNENIFFSPEQVTYRPWHIAMSVLIPLAVLPFPMALILQGTAIHPAGIGLSTFMGAWALAVGIGKGTYAVRALHREGLRGIGLLRALFRSAPIETFDLSTGEVTGLTGLVPLAHTLRSHRIFQVQNEFAAHLLDLIAIPVEMVHAILRPAQTTVGGTGKTILPPAPQGFAARVLEFFRFNAVEKNKLPSVSPSLLTAA